MSETTTASSHHEHLAPSFLSRLTGYIADGLRYWEPRRLIFNLALGAVVIAHFVAALPDSWATLTLNTGLGIFFLAVLANVCYCAVYVIDLFVQFSGLQSAWAKGRVAVLIVGIAFAAVIAHFFSLGIFDGN